MSSENPLPGRKPQQGGGGRQPTGVRTQVQLQQDCIPAINNTCATIIESVISGPDSSDHGVLTTKKQIASRQWDGVESISAASHGNGGIVTNDMGVLAGKLNIANRRWEDGSVPAHQDCPFGPSPVICGGQPHDSVNGAGGAGVGLLESKPLMTRQQDREQVQHDKPTTRNPQSLLTSVVNGVANVDDNNINNNLRTQEHDQPTTTNGSTDHDSINSLSNTHYPIVGQVEQSGDTNIHQQQTAAQQQEQHTNNTGSADSNGTHETHEEREEEPQEVAFDAYVVDEEEQAEYRRRREQELRREVEQQAFNELVRTLPRAEEVDQEELRQQREQAERAVAERRRKLLIRKVTAVAVVAVAIFVACVVAVTHLKDDTKEETSREDEIAWLLEKVSGDAIYNKSSPRHDAFRWLVDEDPMQLNVGGAGVRSFTIVERYVVVLFFLVTGGLSNWTDTFGFLSNSSVCDWYDYTIYKGVRCHDSGSVQYIQVYENNLHGTIPNELSALGELEKLVLFSENLFGTIPSTLQKNTRLRRITLVNNFLSGTIPDLSSLRNIQAIELNNNFLTGTLPAWVTSSTELNFLIIKHNFLSGTIPPFASQGGLEVVDLSFNFFEGSILPTLGSLPVLEELWLSDNQLSGTIPTLIGQAKELQVLVASSNSLTGTIPAELGTLQDLQLLVLHYNSLTGPIPTELGGLTDLVEVHLHGNQLTGTIPSDLAGLEELKHLYLDNNTLTGNVSELCSNQDGDKNTGFKQLIEFYADCDDNALEPEVVCPCCTHCCNDMTGACSPVKTLEEQCQEKAMQWEGSTDNGKVTECECSEGGQVVSCKDPSCMYCNDAHGTLCYVDGKSGMELGIEDKTFFAVSMQYVRGRDEHVALEFHGIDGIEYCSAAINGNECASCWGVTCPGDGYNTFQVDCSNLGYDSVLSACYEGDDPFVMLWDVANSLRYNKDSPVRHDCLPYNTSGVVELNNRG